METSPYSGPIYRPSGYARCAHTETLVTFLMFSVGMSHLWRSSAQSIACSSMFGKKLANLPMSSCDWRKICPRRRDAVSFPCVMGGSGPENNGSIYFTRCSTSSVFKSCSPKSWPTSPTTKPSDNSRFNSAETSDPEVGGVLNPAICSK